MRFAREVCIAAAVAMIVPAGAAMAASPASTPGDTPAVALKFKEGTAAPFAATRLDGATVDGKVYILGFRDANNNTDGSIWYYDVKADTYVDTGVDMPVPISNYQIAALKDKTGLGLYTFGGRNADGDIITTVQVYYPATGDTAMLNKDGWPGTTPSGCVSMPGTGIAVAGNMAYVLGGQSYSTSVPPCTDDNSAEVWSFDPMAKNGKKWSQGPSLNVARGYVAAAVVGKNIYAIGGNTNDAGTLNAIPTVEAWKIGAKKWNDKKYADLPQGCDETQAFAYNKGKLGKTITLAGCGQWPAALPDVLQYDVAADSWSTVGALNEARRNQLGADIGKMKKPQLMVLGGYAPDGATTLASSEIGKAGKALAGPLVVPANPFAPVRSAVTN